MSTGFRAGITAAAVGLGLLLSACGSSADGVAGPATGFTAPAPTTDAGSSTPRPTTVPPAPTTVEQPTPTPIPMPTLPTIPPRPSTSAAAPTTSAQPPTPPPATTTSVPVPSTPEPTGGIECPACGEGLLFGDTVLMDPADFPGTAGGIGFVTPSQNISCAFDPADEWAACQIGEHSYDVPAEGRCDSFGPDGGAVEVNGTGSGFICAGDYFTGGPTLEYGQSLLVGEFACASRTTGVQCVHLPTGSAFIISRDFFQFT